MSILLFSPVGTPETVERKKQRAITNVTGLRVGYVFNQHTSALTFWKSLEGEVDRTMAPSAAYRVYKTNTWAPAPKADIERLIRETDYAVVGVGA